MDNLLMKVKYKKQWCSSYKILLRITLNLRPKRSKSNKLKKHFFLILKSSSEKDLSRILSQNTGNSTIPTKPPQQRWCFWFNQQITILIEKLNRYKVGIGLKMRSVSTCTYTHLSWRSPLSTVWQNLHYSIMYHFATMLWAHISRLMRLSGKKVLCFIKRVTILVTIKLLCLKIYWERVRKIKNRHNYFYLIISNRVFLKFNKKSRPEKCHFLFSTNSKVLFLKFRYNRWEQWKWSTRTQLVRTTR